MKGSQATGIVIAIILIVFSIAFPMPEKHLRTSMYRNSYNWTDDSGEEYVGGDAYNYQMEASLKAGYMSGVLAMKSISLIGGLLLLFLTLYSRIICEAKEEQNQLLSALEKSAKECVGAIALLPEKTDRLADAFKELSEALNKDEMPDEDKDMSATGTAMKEQTGDPDDTEGGFHDE